MNRIKQYCYFLSIAFLLSPCLALAQKEVEPTSTSALERIEKKMDVIAVQSENSTRINIEQPLGERTQGFEFNFLRLLTQDENESSLSGTYSIFNTDNNTEIAFPFMFSSAEHNSLRGYDLVDSNEKLTSITVDMHYRKYLGHRLDGFYLSAFARAAYLDGLKSDENIYYDIFSPPPNLTQASTGSEVKVGIGIGIGYRIISDSGYYWGTSLSIGKYLVGESDVFLAAVGASATLDDEEFIVDIELLKFGFAF